MNHALVVRALRDTVRGTLASVLANANAAIHEATHAESKAENKYDTRGLEASYLAAGQAVRVGALQRVVAFFDQLGDEVATVDVVVGLGALVCLEDHAGALRWCFVAPDGGGIVVTVDGTDVRVVTRGSPLGEALIGATEGDVLEITEPRKQELTVVRVTGSV